MISCDSAEIQTDSEDDSAMIQKGIFHEGAAHIFLLSKNVFHETPKGSMEQSFKAGYMIKLDKTF